MEFVRLCPVCGQQCTDILFRPAASPGPVAQCRHCGMVYIATIEERHALIFDGPVTAGYQDLKVLTSSNLADVTDSWEFKLLPEKEDEWPALRQNALDALQHIAGHCSQPDAERKLLDFGSGWGFFLAVAKEQGWTPYGLEPLPASAVYARATFDLTIVTDTLSENTFPPDCFDVITAFQVFEHLPYPQENLQQLHKMLRPDGIIVIEVPNFATWTMRIMGSHHRHFVQDHLNFFSVETLSHLLSSSGFRVIGHYYPTRRMSVRHFSKRWLRSYLPPFIGNALQGALEKTRFWEQTIGLNLGDILTVVARKLS